MRGLLTIVGIGSALAACSAMGGCKGKDQDDSATPHDDSGTTAAGATHVTAQVFGTMGPEDVDAIEMIHVVGGAMAELTNVPEFNYLVEGTLSMMVPPPRDAPPPPIGEVICVSRVVQSETQVVIDYAGCSDDRTGTIHLEGTEPTVATFQDFTIFGYTVSGSLAFVPGIDVGSYDFESSDAGGASGGSLTIVRPDGPADVSADGSVLVDFDDEELMQLDASMYVTTDGTRELKVGNGGSGTLALNPSFPLTWSLESDTPRRPIAGTIAFDATTGTYTADITAETLEMELGLSSEIVPLAGIMDVPVILAEQPMIGVSYGKESTQPGTQVEADSYSGTIQTADVLTIARDCALSQDDCDALAEGIDAALADTVTVNVDWTAVVSAFGQAYDASFDAGLMPAE
jgi:hypothetical protein